jgi:hypothetical protein
MNRIASAVLGLLLVVLVGRDFALATTFLGDDYIFRAFARLEPNPLVAFVADKHGGEYYRPIPMLLWWGLERLGEGSVWPFALSAFLLHSACAGLLVMCGRELGASQRASALAGALFFAAPAQRDAALWFSASTDLVAAVAMLGSLGGWLAKGRTARAASLALAGVALFSKETALVLPLLIGAACWYRQPTRDWRRIWRATVPYCAVALLYLGARTWVLHGMGGSGDARAPWWAVGVQILSGGVHAVSAYSPLPEWSAWLLGGAGLAAGGVALRRSRLGRLAALWALLAVLPLPAAGWVVGARYFYFCGAGLMLLLALALEMARPWIGLAVLAMLVGLGTVAASKRMADIRLYRQVVAAARDAVADGVARGHRLFLVRGAVKDLDLAIKLGPSASPALQDTVAIPDIPASFIWLPHRGEDRIRFLLAEPPLPPSGSYRFAGERIVGLARREEAPDLDEVLAKLPDLRIIQLKLEASPVAWEDSTAEYSR